MRKPLTLLMVVALFGLGACGGDDDDSASSSGTEDEFANTTSSVPGDEEAAFTEDEADHVLEYSLIEYEFNGPFEVEAGDIFLKATNDGEEDHELEVLDADGEALGEIAAMPPGDEGTFAVTMEPGTYTFQCILETEDGESHKDLGMESEFTVTGEEGSTPSTAAGSGGPTTSSQGESATAAFTEAEADGVLDYSLVEYSFDGPKKAKAGKVFFKGSNDGAEDHELEVLGPDGEALGEIAAMGPGKKGTFAVELESGEYVLQCILENENGKAHTDLGMTLDLLVE